MAANLINSAADLKANFSSLSLNFTWANISSFANDVEMDIISDAIGPEALTWFQGNVGALNGIPAQALVLLQRCTSYLTVLKWSQTALFEFEDKALFISTTTKGAIPSDKKLVDLRKYCEEEGFRYLDRAIDLMENNLASFTQYRDSATREQLNQAFIKTAKDFSIQRNINNSRLTFLSMMYFMLDIQSDKLPDVMTPAYYALFQERYMDGDLSTDELKLLPYIKKAVAMYTIAEACKQLPVRFNKNGLYVNKFEGRTEYAQKDAADQSRLQFMADDHEDKGQRWLLQLQSKMNDGTLTLPGYVIPTPAGGDIVQFAVSGVVTPPGIGSTYSVGGNVYEITAVNMIGGSGYVQGQLISGISALAGNGVLANTSGTGDAAITYSAYEIGTNVNNKCSGLYLFP